MTNLTSGILSSTCDIFANITLCPHSYLLNHNNQQNRHINQQPIIILCGATFLSPKTTPLNYTSLFPDFPQIQPLSLTKLSQKPKTLFKYKKIMVATTDICDANSSLLSTGELKVLLPLFKPYGQRRAFNGPVVTVKVFEDNVLVRALLESKAHQGKVLVVDGGGSIRCALLGGNLGQIAQDNGWAGIVVNGCVRDVDEINACDIGVWALGTSPVKSHKKGVGEKHGSVHFAGAVINDGDWLWADNDGILISRHQLSTTS